MPQMAPIWWTSILSMNLCLIMMLMTMLYFNSKKINPSFEKLSKIKFNWKW
nr:ATP synthase F0 subunit 8 [Multinervis sp.]